MLAQEIYFVEIVPGRGIMRCAALREKEPERVGELSRCAALCTPGWIWGCDLLTSSFGIQRAFGSRLRGESATDSLNLHPNRPTPKSKPAFCRSPRTAEEQKIWAERAEKSHQNILFTLWQIFWNTNIQHSGTYKINTGKEFYIQYTTYLENCS